MSRKSLLGDNDLGRVVKVVMGNGNTAVGILEYIDIRHLEIVGPGDELVRVNHDAVDAVVVGETKAEMVARTEAAAAAIRNGLVDEPDPASPLEIPGQGKLWTPEEGV